MPQRPPQAPPKREGLPGRPVPTRTPSSKMPENESKPRVSDAPVTKPKEGKIKEPRGPLVTAEGVSQFLFVVLVSLFFYLMICGVVYGAFYCATHVRFNWNYDVTVKLDDSSKKPPKYTTSRDIVFKDESEIPYISMAKLALSLDLSSMGDAKQIKFYKTNDLENYVVFTHRSKEVVINGVTVTLGSKVYISGGTAIVPIEFFNYYTTGVRISYEESERLMTVLYTIDEELSTPQRKVLKEFCFASNIPQPLEEMTGEEWFEYVGSQK